MAANMDGIEDQQIDETVRMAFDEKSLGLFSNDMQKPGLKTKINHAVDHDADIMDRSVLRSNFYLSLQDKKNIKSKTIVPFELELDFISKFKRGLSTRFGFT